MHLAIKLFDIVSLANPDCSIHNPKNQPKNLKILAAQCLLLASKFNEITRLYPAEVVYQVKDWGEQEFKVLSEGSVEEYLLNVLDFDLMFLTPVDFLEFLVECWEGCVPRHDCLKCKKSITDRINRDVLKSKLKLFAYQAINTMVADHCGHAISLKYLPSAVAVQALQLALRTALA